MLTLGRSLCTLAPFHFASCRVVCSIHMQLCVLCNSVLYKTPSPSSVLSQVCCSLLTSLPAKLVRWCCFPSPVACTPFCAPDTRFLQDCDSFEQEHSQQPSSNRVVLSLARTLQSTAASCVPPSSCAALPPHVTCSCAPKSGFVFPSPLLTFSPLRN